MPAEKLNGKNTSVPAFEYRIPKVTFRAQPKPGKLMTSLTVSNSGTAWFKDMQALGQSPTAAGGWAKSPNAAYYASLDTDHPLPKPDSAPALPTSMADLLK